MSGLLCFSVQEEIADLDKRSQQRDLREWALVVLSRLLANLFVLLILSATAVAIFYAAQLGLDSVRHHIHTHTYTNTHLTSPPPPSSLPPHTHSNCQETRPASSWRDWCCL